MKHLSSLGYSVSFNQGYIDEYEYTIDKTADLFTGMKDGVRLARLYEILSTSPSVSSPSPSPSASSNADIMNELRVPAVSFLQKKHNLSLVLTTAFGKDHGISIDSLIEGNKQLILMVLWKFMYTFDLKIMITSEAVKEEIVRIQKKSTSSFDTFSSSFSSLSLINSDDVEASLLLWCQTIANQYFLPSSSETAHQNLSVYHLLDGKILCLLIYYYHPYLFPKSMISLIFPSEIQKSDDEAIRKKKLLRYFFYACKNLGGIPNILDKFSSESELMKQHYCHPNELGKSGSLSPSTSSQDQKTIVLFLSYLFMRLVDSSKQMKAIVLIQRRYRFYKNLKYQRKKKGSNSNNNSAKSSPMKKTKGLSNPSKSRLSMIKSAVTGIVDKQSTELDKATYSPEITVLAPAAINKEDQSFDAMDLSHLIVESIESIDYYYDHHKENRDDQQQQPEENHHRLNESTSIPLNDVLSQTYEPVIGKLDFGQAIEDVNNEPENDDQSIEELDEFDVNSLLQPDASSQQQQQLNELYEKEQKELEEEKTKLFKKQEKSAIIIQSRYRCYNERRQFLCKRLVILIIQSMWKRKLMIRRFHKMQVSVMLIINKYRTFCAVRSYQKWRKTVIIAVKKIQQVYRAFKVKQQYNERKQKNIIKKQQKEIQIKQSTFMNKLKMKLFITKIQKMWKSYQLKQKASKTQKQSDDWDNAVLSFKDNYSKRVIRRFLLFSFSKIQLQKVKAISATKIQKSMKVFLIKRHFSHFLHGLKSFIAVYRGYLIRRLFYSNKATKVQKKLLNILSNLRHNHCYNASENVIDCDMSSMTINGEGNGSSAIAPPSKGLTLHAKAQHALHILHNGKMISHYMKACNYLLTYTAVCREVCELFVYTNSPIILFRLLQTCNRSTPHQELLK
jgi:hypothetical protein